MSDEEAALGKAGGGGGGGVAALDGSANDPLSPSTGLCITQTL